jgi:hypothetical protein
MYWISKQQCAKVLDKVDRPMRLFSNNYSIKRILDSVSEKELLKTVFVAYPALSLLTKEECSKEEYEMNSLWTDSDKHDYYSISGEVLNNEKNVPKNHLKNQITIVMNLIKEIMRVQNLIHYLHLL